MADTEPETNQECHQIEIDVIGANARTETDLFWISFHKMIMEALHRKDNKEAVAIFQLTQFNNDALLAMGLLASPAETETPSWFNIGLDVDATGARTETDPLWLSFQKLCELAHHRGEKEAQVSFLSAQLRPTLPFATLYPEDDEHWLSSVLAAIGADTETDGFWLSFLKIVKDALQQGKEKAVSHFHIAGSHVRDFSVFEIAKSRLQPYQFWRHYQKMVEEAFNRGKKKANDHFYIAFNDYLMEYRAATAAYEMGLLDHMENARRASTSCQEASIDSLPGADPDERPSTEYENYREAVAAAYEMHMENARRASTACQEASIDSL